MIAEPLASFNGVRQPLSAVRVSALDRGFLFGDGVYEVVRVYGGRPFLLEAHWSRLGRSLDALRLSGVDLAALAQECRSLVEAAAFPEALLYVQVTRGAAPKRAHGFDENLQPTVLAWVEPFEDTFRAARANGISAVTEPDPRWGRCDIKSLNLLGNVLAVQAAKDRASAEAILVNRDGWVTEGTRTNIFAVIGGILRTMPLGPAILAGVTRAEVLALARALPIVTEELPIAAADLRLASEIFTTGTTSEILPVVRLDGLSVGEGVPGPRTVELQRAYRELQLGA